MGVTSSASNTALTLQMSEIFREMFLYYRISFGLFQLIDIESAFQKWSVAVSWCCSQLQMQFIYGRETLMSAQSLKKCNLYEVAGK